MTPRAVCSRFLAIASLCLALTVRAGMADTAPVTVTITQRSPIETLSSSGAVIGVTESTQGTHFTLISADGNKVTLQDAQGVHYRIAQASTDYTASTTSTAPPPTPTPPASPAATSGLPGLSSITSLVNTAMTNAAMVNNAATNAASSMLSSASSLLGQDTAQTSGPPVTDDGVATINKEMGKSFFTTQPLWKESALLIANRLELGLEDKTKWETAYRRYFYDRKGLSYEPAAILGGKAYCVALYADANNVPTSLLIAFTNDGDYEGVVVLISDIYRLQHPTGVPLPDADKQITEMQAKVDKLEQSFEHDRQVEEETLTKNLTTLFGEPKRTTFGTTAETRENALRWDWNGSSLLLTCLENKYNLLRIIPTELADKHGRTELIPHEELAAKLANAVEHRPNGDVVITQLPMAAQGLKGYCVPATWERVLRYTGVPGDMYTLSRIGGARFGGGELGGDVAAQLDNTLHDYGRRAEFLRIEKIDTLSLHHYIDAGIPIFWVVNPEGYTTVDQRYNLCDRDKDWSTWKQLLIQSRLPTKTEPPPLPNYGGHQVLITGYNPDTKEIAWSDPWGRHTEERWMTEEEAQRCSLGEFYIISW